jgi:dienelactone hydrolase
MWERLEYQVAERRFSGLVICPDDGAARCPGVLVLHGGGGLGEHERERTRRLAACGYVAFAPDLFGEVYSDRAAGMKAIGALSTDAARLRVRVTAALHALKALSRVDAGRTAAVGHCFGGLAALELARSGAEVRAAVSLHGGLATSAPAERGAVQARVLVCTGAEDPYCPREQRLAFEAEMTAAEADWQHHIYAQARHGFSVPGMDAAKHPGCAYHALADQRSFRAMLGLFDEVFRPQ